MRKILSITIVAVLIGAALAGSKGVSAGGGCHQELLTDESGTHVEMSNRCFGPTVIRVPVGEDVTWTNSDPDAHTVTGAANSWGTYDELLADQSVSYRFERAGVYPYFCVLHPSMVGAVVAGDGGAASNPVANGGVKAVSAEVPGGGESAADELVSDSGNGGTDLALIAGGAAAVAVLLGFASAWLIRRRAV